MKERDIDPKPVIMGGVKPEFWGNKGSRGGSGGSGGRDQGYQFTGDGTNSDTNQLACALLQNAYDHGDLRARLLAALQEQCGDQPRDVTEALGLSADQVIGRRVKQLDQLERNLSKVTRFGR